MKTKFPLSSSPRQYSTAGRGVDLILWLRLVFWSVQWEQTSWPRGFGFGSGVISAVLSCSHCLWRAWVRNVVRAPGSPLHQGLFHGLGQLRRGHLQQWGLLRGVLPDSGFIELKENMSWALQSSAPSFISTYCLLRVPLKMSGQTAGLGTLAIHTCI